MELEYIQIDCDSDPNESDDIEQNVRKHFPGNDPVYCICSGGTDVTIYASGPIEFFQSLEQYVQETGELEEFAFLELNGTEPTVDGNPGIIDHDTIRKIA